MKSSCLFLLVILSVATIQVSAAETRDFPVSVRSSLQSNPTLAYNRLHNQFLITWTDVRYQSKSDVDVFGRILDATGNAVTDDIVISDAKGGQAESAVAFDPDNKNYLIVWSDWRNAESIDSDIYGQLLDYTGIPLGENFPISEWRISQKQPATAYDPDRNRFLVVWKDDRLGNIEKLYGRFVSPQGTLLESEFLLAQGKGKQDNPSLKYDPKRKRFLVVWRDLIDKDRVDEAKHLSSPLEGKGIFATFVSESDADITPGILIDTGEDACMPPSLYAADYSPIDDIFLVVWTTARDYKKLGLDVFGALIRASDGKRVGQAFSIAIEKNYQEFPSVVYDHKRNRFLVVWYDLRRDQSALNMDIYGRYVSPQGEMSDEFLITDKGAPGIRRYPTIAYSEKSGTTLVLWEDSRKKTNKENYQRIFARLVEAK